MRWTAYFVIAFFSWALASPENYFFPRFAGTGADDASYVAYAFSLGLDGDLDFSNEIADRITTFPNGRALPVHPSGPGLMAAPVVAVFSLVDRANDHPVINDRTRIAGSWSYFGYLATSAGSLMGGLLLTTRTALLISNRLSPLFLVLILGGSGLAYYGLRQFTMGHSFEFFASSMVLWAVVLLRRRDFDPIWAYLMLSAGVSLSLLIRPANVNIVLLPLLAYLIMQISSNVQVLRSANRPQFWWLAAGTLTGLFGTLAVNAILLGTPYPSFRQQYSSEGVQASLEGHQSPLGLLDAARELAADIAPRAGMALRNLSDLQTVIFTQEYGLLWFMPIVPIGGLMLIVSLVLLGRRHGQRWLAGLIGVLSIIYAAIPLGVVLTWQSHASSFGFRYLFSLVPVGLLGLALWSRIFQDLVSERVLNSLFALLGGLALCSLFGQAFHGTSPSLSLSPGTNSFGQYSASNRSFASSVLVALTQPDAWTNMMARGLLGFLVLVLVNTSGIERIGAITRVSPQRRADNLAELASMYASEVSSAAPGTVVFAILFFACIVPLCVARVSLATAHTKNSSRSLISSFRAQRRRKKTRRKSRELD